MIVARAGDCREGVYCFGVVHDQVKRACMKGMRRYTQTMFGMYSLSPSKTVRQEEQASNRTEGTREKKIIKVPHLPVCGRQESTLPCLRDNRDISQEKSTTLESREKQASKQK